MALFGGSSNKKNYQMFLQYAMAQQAAQQQAAQQKQLVAAQQEASSRLEAQAQASAAAQQEAQETAYRASLTPGDSEDARQASERRSRRLLSGRGFAASIAKAAGLGDASIATRQLLGA